MMEWGIVVDSCCDIIPEICDDVKLVSVPLTINLGDRSFSDNEELDMPSFLEDIKDYQGKIGTAAPAPLLFKDAFVKSCKAFAVTLSSNLSGSYASSLVGQELAQEEGAEVHVFDSKSASAGEVLISLKIGEMIRAGVSKQTIIEKIDAFIQQMKTYFVLENIDTLLKNGRIGKITGKIITALNIKPIMGSDGNGNIALFSHARGEKQTIEKLSDMIRLSGRDMTGECMVIAHCNNITLAEKLKGAIQQRHSFKDILIVPTRGISSVYANDKGLVLAF
ncbi:DegV family protein [Oscillospiraceae bacterium CM]|nr:DegV family protein [Oscillospiraceae bacterium CM]